MVENSASGRANMDRKSEDCSSEGASAWHTATRILGIVLLVLALSVVVFTRFELARTKSYLEHDEAIGVLGATGHDIPFQTARVAMSNRWVPASTWQSYLKVDKPFDFASVERGLSKTDVAPPLYFWLLHVWLLVFGSTTTTPMLFNIPIAMTTALAIVGLVRRATGNFALGAAAALAWALTLPAWTLSNMARPYDFLALCSVLIVWQTLRFLDENASRVWDTLLLGLAFAAGMLSQYYFAITAVSIVIVVLLAALRRKERSLAVRLAAAVGGGMVLFFSLNPHWYGGLMNGRDRFAVEKTSAAFSQRTSQVIRTFAPGSGLDKQVRVWALSVQRLAPAFHLRYVVLVAVLVLVALVSIVIARGDWLKRVSFEAGSTIFVAAWTSGVTVLLYLAFVSPPWAMADRYMAAPWALGVPAIVVFLSTFSKRTVWWAVSAWVLLMFWTTVGPITRIVNQPAPSLGNTSAVRHVVIDATPRGFVTRYLLALPGTAEVFVANEPDLVANTAPWLSQIQPGDLYVRIPGGSGPNPVPLSEVLAGRLILTPIPGVTVERFALP